MRATQQFRATAVERVLVWDRSNQGRDSREAPVANKIDECTRCLVHVRYAAAALEESRASLQRAVAIARSAGASRAEIAEAMDISPQALDQLGPRDPADAP
jgi:hypothetical protein